MTSSVRPLPGPPEPGQNTQICAEVSHAANARGLSGGNVRTEGNHACVRDNLLFASSEALAIDLTGTGYSAEHLAAQLLAFLAAKG
jgi:hypothetical protein